MRNHLVVLIAAGIAVYLFINHFFGSVAGFTTSLSNGSVWSTLTTSSASVASGSVPMIQTASITQGSGSLGMSGEDSFYQAQQANKYSPVLSAQPNNIAVHKSLALPVFFGRGRVNQTVGNA